MSLMSGKVGLVTGAGSGIGRACAELLAREAAAGLVIADVDEQGGEETARRAAAAGVAASFVRCDVSQPDEVGAMVKSVLERHGKLDFAINNAGISHRSAPLAEVDEVDFDRVVAVNLKGTWLCLKHEIPVMQAAGGGAIVNTASRAGLRGTALGGAYSATKHGVIGLTRSAAAGYIDAGIRVNCICPGVVKTPLIAALPAERIEQLGRRQPGRLATPEEVAEAAVWLCSSRASFVSGVALPVDNGWTAGD